MRHGNIPQVCLGQLYLLVQIDEKRAAHSRDSNQRPNYSSLPENTVSGTSSDLDFPDVRVLRLPEAEAVFVSQAKGDDERVFVKTQA